MTKKDMTEIAQVLANGVVRMSKYQSLDDAILARVKNRRPLPMTLALLMATSQVRDLAEAAVAGTSRPAFRAVDARLQALRKKGLIEYSNALGWRLTA